MLTKPVNDCLRRVVVRLRRRGQLRAMVPPGQGARQGRLRHGVRGRALGRRPPRRRQARRQEQGQPVDTRGEIVIPPSSR